MLKINKYNTNKSLDIIISNYNQKAETFMKIYDSLSNYNLIIAVDSEIDESFEKELIKNKVLFKRLNSELKYILLNTTKKQLAPISEHLCENDLIIYGFTEKNHSINNNDYPIKVDFYFSEDNIYMEFDLRILNNNENFIYNKKRNDILKYLTD